MVIVEGHGSTVVDADGTEYLDAMAGLWCVNVGYGRTELADVAAAQMRALPYYPHTAMNAPAAALAGTVNGLLGGDNHVYFVASGSEANEAAFKIARQYMKHEHPDQTRYKTISRYLGYHGTDAGHPGRRRHGRPEGQVRAAERQRLRPRGARPTAIAARSGSATRPASWRA